MNFNKTNSQISKLLPLKGYISIYCMFVSKIQQELAEFLLEYSFLNVLFYSGHHLNS